MLYFKKAHWVLTALQSGNHLLPDATPPKKEARLMCERKRLSAEPRGSASHSLRESLMRSLSTQALFSHTFTLHYSVWRWAVRRVCQLSLTNGPDFFPPWSLTRTHLTPVWWLNYGSPLLPAPVLMEMRWSSNTAAASPADINHYNEMSNTVRLSPCVAPNLLAVTAAAAAAAAGREGKHKEEEGKRKTQQNPSQAQTAQRDMD